MFRDLSFCFVSIILALLEDGIWYKDAFVMPLQKMLRDANYRPVNPILVRKVDIPIGNKDPFEGL